MHVFPNSDPSECNQNQMKLTYLAAIRDAVLEAGVLSRPGLVAAVARMGLTNEQQLTIALRRMVSDGTLAKEGASYVLSPGAELSSEERTRYDQRRAAAMASRAEAEKSKQAGRLREAKRVAKAFKAAQRPAKCDRKLALVGKLAGL